MKSDSGSHLIELSHTELTLLLFTLEGGKDIDPENPACEDACPVVEHLEQHLNVSAASTEKKLVHHLNSHIREGLIECGAFELMAEAKEGALSIEQQAKMREINVKLDDWRCQIRLDEEERAVLRQSIKRLPRSAWLVMPKKLWRLRKKLKVG
ncbi:MAG: hypothetical protein AB1631_26995 [Acidobacteriota bacterium]